MSWRGNQLMAVTKQDTQHQVGEQETCRFLSFFLIQLKEERDHKKQRSERSDGCDHKKERRDGTTFISEFFPFALPFSDDVTNVFKSVSYGQDGMATEIESKRMKRDWWSCVWESFLCNTNYLFLPSSIALKWWFLSPASRFLISFSSLSLLFTTITPVYRSKLLPHFHHLVIFTYFFDEYYVIHVWITSRNRTERGELVFGKQSKSHGWSLPG